MECLIVFFSNTRTHTHTHTHSFTFTHSHIHTKFDSIVESDYRRRARFVFVCFVVRSTCVYAGCLPGPMWCGLFHSVAAGSICCAISLRSTWYATVLTDRSILSSASAWLFFRCDAYCFVEVHTLCFTCRSVCHVFSWVKTN